MDKAIKIIESEIAQRETANQIKSNLRFEIIKEEIQQLKKVLELVNKTNDIHSVSERVFCFLYSDGDEIHSKSAIAETRIEARKIIEDKYPKLFLLRNDGSYENVR